MQTIPELKEYFEGELEGLVVDGQPRGLYEPIAYILGLGGKRLRPILTLMAARAYDGDLQKAIPAAMAVEVFHNFSLMHDDIMDEAPLRRGAYTVHRKWDLNSGILSGDAMLILSYRLLENYSDNIFASLAKVFSKTSLEVCEGQQYDMDFENRTDVTIPEYLLMIRNKTAVLLGAALRMGGIVSGAPITDQKGLYGFGTHLGLAFQIQDDYLDTFGDASSFGKQIGGDIIANKKTFLYLTALEISTSELRKELLDLYSIKPSQPADKIKRVSEIFEESGAKERALYAIGEYTEKAMDFLKELSISEEHKRALEAIGQDLSRRSI